MYSLSLDKDRRIIYATYKEYYPEGVLVESIPDNDVTDYRYINGEYVYDPLPKPKPEPPPKPATDYVTRKELNMALSKGVNSI